MNSLPGADHESSLDTIYVLVRYVELQEMDRVQNSINA